MLRFFEEKETEKFPFSYFVQQIYSMIIYINQFEKTIKRPNRDCARHHETNVNVI